MMRRDCDDLIETVAASTALAAMEAAALDNEDAERLYIQAALLERATALSPK
jgi:hypothetical protein